MDDLFAIDEDLKGAKLYKRLLTSWNSGKFVCSSGISLVAADTDLCLKSTAGRNTV